MGHLLGDLMKRGMVRSAQSVKTVREEAQSDNTVREEEQSAEIPTAASSQLLSSLSPQKGSSCTVM